MAAPKEKNGSMHSQKLSQLSISQKDLASSPKGGNKKISYAKPITVEELHKWAQDFEKNHKKDVKSLATLNAAQLYLKQYWGFYILYGKNAQNMNDKIRGFFKQNAQSECFMMYQLAVNAREVLCKNKINLPYGHGDKPTELDLRGLMPAQKKKLVKQNTPPKLNNGNQILALFASLQNENNV